MAAPRFRRWSVEDGFRRASPLVSGQQYRAAEENLKFAAPYERLKFARDCLVFRRVKTARSRYAFVVGLMRPSCRFDALPNAV